MDDPIFDPWCLGEESRPSRKSRTSRWRPVATTRVVPVSRLAPTPVSPQVALLRSAVLPRVEALRWRLAASRHEATLDNHLDQAPPRLRLKIVPWRGPFDEPGDAPGSVLEMVVDSARDSSVTARLWLDPLAPSPEEEVRVGTKAVTATWVDGVLLDFLDRVFRGR